MHKYIMCIDPVSNRLKEELNMRESLLSRAIRNLRYPSIESGNGCRKGISYASFCPRGERENYISSKMSRIFPKLCQLVLVMVLMGAFPFATAQSIDESYRMKPTPILRGASAVELTTVLLVNKNGVGRLGDTHGRFLSVRPEVGLLTSTARTFIQEGVTTEYATEVVGTTLNNGRLYAQYLKKSSRVLFENSPNTMSPSVFTSWVGDSVQSSQTRSYLQSHNDLLNADFPDWQEIDDRLVLEAVGVPSNGNDHDFIGNTDFIMLKSVSQLVSKPVESNSIIKEIKYNSDVKFATRSRHMEDNARKVAADKVLPIGDLPTFTIKNNFEPSGYQIKEGQDTQIISDSNDNPSDEGRSAKIYQHNVGQNVREDKSYHQPINTPKRQLSTVTYYGFADFTTLVGDSLIVFQPRTSQPSSSASHVTSIKGMATLRTSDVNFVLTTMKIHSTKTAEVVESATTTEINEWASFSDATEPPRSDMAEISTPNISELILEASKLPTPNLDSITGQKVISDDIGTIEARPMFSLPTDQEILQIYSSLAKAQSQSAQLSLSSSEVIGEISASRDQIVESNQVHEGATTIFIDDDPFANFVEPTSVKKSLLSITTPIATISTEQEETTTEITSTEDSEVSTTSLEDVEKSYPLYSQISENITETPSMIKVFNSPNDAIKENCAHISSQVYLTQLLKTDMNVSSTKNNENDKKEPVSIDIKETTKFYCLESTKIIESPQLEKPKTVLQESIQSSQSFISDAVGTEGTLAESQTEATIPTVREKSSIDAETAKEMLKGAVNNVTESVNVNYNENDDYDGENVSDEIDLIYKTLYTTYTYLTTFFQAQSTTVSSHTEIITNIVTSTLGIDEDATTINNIQSFPAETPTMDMKITVSPNIQATQTRYMIPDELESLLHVTTNGEQSKSISFYEQNTYLNDTKKTKTFYTTYTYYTTIFADTETDIMSRTEVFTNYVTELGWTTETIVDDILPDKTPSAFDHGMTLSVSESQLQSDIPNVEDKNAIEISQNKEEYLTLVTDIRTSSSNGDDQVVGKKGDDDQISSESNTEEIIPSATFLLQTSFTTFTFYTTMYVSDSTNVVSRLETVTNIATETIQPTKVLVHDEATLPITFFTTFTYWTKLAKDGEITTISREETISNIIEPTSRLVLDLELSSNPTSISDLSSISNEGGQNNKSFTNNNFESIQLNPKIDAKNFVNLDASEVSELTTFYTTYTYYTTSYDANRTVTNSRFETVTNVITPLSKTISKTSATNVEPTISITQDQSIYISENNYESKNKDIIFYDYKHIIDADGISTLYFTTQVQSTVDNEGVPIEITSSTSSLYINEVKRSNSPATEQTLESGSSRQYKTGLARLIEGTRIGNSTTTLYQSKVIGTIINNRYAQIIESTSSFIFEKRIATSTVQPSSTSDDITTTQMVSLQSLLPEVEGSVNTDSTEQSTSIDSIDDNDNNNASLSLQTKKRTFAPVIRPFASRNRPTFSPKQKTLSPSSATIITRSDITPTITATPALKSVGRFSTSRRGTISNAPINTLDGGSTSSRRLFGRPIKSSTNTAVNAGASQSGSNFSLASSGFSQSRNRFVSSSRAAPISSSRRLSINSLSRPSSSINFRVSALSVGSSRQRIRPASVIGHSATTSTLKQLNADSVDADEEPSAENSTESNADEEKNYQISRRNQNPLLRFRRPLGRPSGFTPVPRANANAANISPRKNPLTGRTKTSTATTTTTTTARPRPRNFQRPTISSFQARARPQNNLFPPRGLFKQHKDQAQVDNEASHNINDTETDSDYDDDDEGEDDDADGEVQNETRRRRSSNKTAAKVSSNPKLSRRRREADTLNRNKFRFRRPKAVTTEEPILLNSDERILSTTHTPNSARPKINSRFGSRYMVTHKPQTSTSAPAISSHRSIRPSRPTSPRTQFTLREQDASIKSRQSGTSLNFRRQQSSARRTPTISSSTSASRRLKNYSTHNNNVENSGRRASNTARARKGNANMSTRSRTTMRGRSRIEYNSDSQSTELGSVTITVTHLIPAEVTVPVINGQVTEYKNIVTAKTSLEVLGPHQYTQILGSNGQLSLYLTREESAINSAGATELTRYLLRESLTSTVTFTPTTIRGRKTSFSHVLPSTVYSVENLVSTVQPQIAANAPLANILLSQLLLGNINLPSNPLLGAIAQPHGMSQIIAVEPSAPVTEYRTHTSTYVTTIYDGKSTILPITFQGKKILTTVFDTTAQTITATEYNVDTIVNTPSHQVVQASSQVAQVNNLLLQQLLLQQQQQQQLQASVAQVMQTTSPNILLSDDLQDLEDGVRFDGDSIIARDNIDDIIAIDDRIHTNKNRKKTRKSNKGQKRNKQQQTKSEEESSVVTLYVSGRRPGSNKRHVKHETAHSSKSESTTDSMSRLQNNQLVAINSDNILNESLDQARFNLATHVMSNGVQLIIASDKIKHIDKQAPSVHSSSISLSSRNVQQKPVTLAPSTLKNHMILAVPTVRQENFSIPIEENQFITKTCLTTYTYHTTYLNKGSTTVESREKIVLNRQTEERKFLRASSKLSLGVTLSNIPELVVGIFPTTYHYYNSIKNNDFVIRSSYTIINTVTGPEDYISFLQPSEDATPLLDTNTYYSPLNVIITHLDGVDATRFLADENILTQVVITESIPPRGASKSKNCETLTAANQMEEEIQIYATKTYLTTVTYHLSTDLGLKSEGQSSIPEHEMEAQTNLQTKVIVNVMTDVVPNSLLRPELVSVFQTELIQTKGQNNRKVLVTLATLLSGETLQITAVNIQKNSSTATPTVLLRDQELVKHSFDSLNPTSVIVNTDKDETTKVQVQQNLDQSLSESEKNSVYIKPVMKQPSQSSSMSASPTVDQLIGSLNLKRFRPVFDVMAEFLQKQLVNRQAETKQNMDDLSVMEKNQTNRLSTQNQLDEKPVYIPLQTPEPHTDFQTNSIKPISHSSNHFKSDINSSSINLKRLTAYSLHINPPDFPDGATDSWLRQQNNNSSPTYIESVRPHSAYGNSVLNNGISIRPGEIINANADVIIGRPNGIGIQYFRQNALSKTHSDNDILIEYTNQTSTNYNVSPLKKKNWIPPAIPLSLTPPRIIPIDVGNKYYNLERLKTNRNQHRGLADGFNHILRPPASQAVHKYTEFSTASSSSGAKFKLPGIDNRPSNNRNSHLYGSQQLIGNLNAELHDNKILEIKQIPQIFATQLPTITTYLMSDSNYYQHISPKISAHHHVSLKTDVLNHNVNINVPPLTFKRESENFPLGTALRGHIATPPIPLIKIPLNKAHVEVEITPQNTRLSINAANTANDSSIIKQIGSIFRQRNHNFFKNTESSKITVRTANIGSKTISSNKPYISVSSLSNKKYVDQSQNELENPNNKWNFSETFTKWNVHSGLSHIASNSIKLKQSLVFANPIYDERTSNGSGEVNSQQDQNADYTTYNSNYNLQNENISANFHKPPTNRDVVSSSTVNTWLSFTRPQTIGLGRPFVKSTEIQTHPQTQASNEPNDFPKKVFVANGEQFNIRAQPQDKQEYNFSLPTSLNHIYNTIKPTKLFPTILMPPPLETFLKTEVKQSVVGLQPPALLALEVTPSPSRANNIFNRYASSKNTHRKDIQVLSIYKEPITHQPTTATSRADIQVSSIFLEPIIQKSTITKAMIKDTNTVASRKDTKLSSTFKESGKQNPLAASYSQIAIPSISNESKNVINFKQFPSATNGANALVPHILNNFHSTNLNKTAASSNTVELETITESVLKTFSMLKKVQDVVTTPIWDSGVVSTNTYHDNDGSDNNLDLAAYNNIENSLFFLESSEPMERISSTKSSTGDMNSNTFSNKLTTIRPNNIFLKNKSIISKTIKSNSSRIASSEEEIITQLPNTLIYMPTPIDTEKDVTTTKTKILDYTRSNSNTYAIIPNNTLKLPFRPDMSNILIVMTNNNTNKNNKIIEPQIPLDYDTNITFDTPTRDEEVLRPINSNNVLLGGILMETPPKTLLSPITSQNSCNPACKPNRNEICTNISEYVSHCQCRLGFARMFPDRPCKPTYTFELRMPITRVGSYLLKFNDELISDSLNQNRYLRSIIVDAIDRMVMQSDFRDVYYGVQSKEFNSRKDATELGSFLLKLSENSDVKRLESVFRKYLRKSNYSVGGTELYTSKEDINSLTVKDFDECANDNFNDCFVHAHCFNLVGSYTCSCPDGYVDTSDNPLYPGRHCSDKIIGCDKCNYHGHCVTANIILNETSVCECFAWHAGSSCQLNLKVLLISLITIGTIFILLVVCTLLIYTKRKTYGGTRTRPIFVNTSNYHPSMLTSSSIKSEISSVALIRKSSMGKCSILSDSHSVSSHNAEQYSTFKKLANALQSDRSLTVMIPRAKYYHPSVLPNTQQLKQYEQALGEVDSTPLFKATQNDSKTKYQSADPPVKSTGKECGALVSAGFEVSAIVSDRPVQLTNKMIDCKENATTTDCESSQPQQISVGSLKGLLGSNEDIHRMHSWMRNIPSTEISADIRSFDETTVQPVTKSLQLCFEKRTPSNTIEEANTMAERDLGSTFLLPHTHLYKPEKLESDLSGFDSL